jgi:hypothetical protein
MLAVLNERAEVTRCGGPLAEAITGLMEPDPARRLTAAAARGLLDRAAGANRPKPTAVLDADPKPTAALPDLGHPTPTAVADEPGRPKPTAVYTSEPGQPKPTAVYTSEPDQPKPAAGQTPDPSRPNPVAPGADPYADHPHRERVMAQQAQAMARFRRFRTLTRLAMAAGVVFVAAALVPVIMNGIALRDTLNQSITTPGATTPNAEATTTTRTTTPAVIAAMQPILTYGAGGDITSDTVPTRNDACYAWIPTKGKPAPKTFDYVDCDAPHGVQSLDYGIITPELDAPYPTPTQMTSRAVALCTKQFLSRVTVADKERSLRYWVLVPSPAAWSPAEHVYGERTYWCVVGAADGTDLTRSVED